MNGDDVTQVARRVGPNKIQVLGDGKILDRAATERERIRIEGRSFEAL